MSSITGHEPQGVQPGENEERGEALSTAFSMPAIPRSDVLLSETINAQKKALLKVTKAEIEEMREIAAQLARENEIRRYLDWSIRSCT